MTDSRVTRVPAIATVIQVVGAYGEFEKPELKLLVLELLSHVQADLVGQEFETSSKTDEILEELEELLDEAEEEADEEIDPPETPEPIDEKEEEELIETLDTDEEETK